MFRFVMILVVLAGLAFMANWFTINRDEETTTIQIDRQQIRSDLSKAAEKGRKLIEKHRKEGERTVDAGSQPVENSGGRFEGINWE
ncbi:hypothetical protein SV7mr_34920 [Stieleria bergensis]|uniref:Uncharacterized protein n=1 Tax=Stieleria bergensis TaxID=2528025 RepID=A0A517SY27_9BACT|nr:hypothetical protein SV7mr_34920 [Planctomycetes bacterium SV_7m_r]